MTYALSVSDVSPRAMSLLGGAELTITGAGFTSYLDAYDVTVGDKTCHVQSANAAGTEVRTKNDTSSFVNVASKSTGVCSWYLLLAWLILC